MTENNEITDYITFPKTFKEYRWYKPILVFIIGFIIMIILQGILMIAFAAIFGISAPSLVSGGYEMLNNEWGDIFTNLGIIIMIPSLYIATKIVRDRPFSSYSSSRGGWNFKLYLKALIIPFIALMVFQGIDVAINGADGPIIFQYCF